MKYVISGINKTVVLLLLLTSLNACNKDVEATRALSITVRGFNIGNTELEISVDTLVYHNNKVAPNTELNFNMIFTYPGSKKDAVLRIKDLISGKEVYTQQLPLNNDDLERFFQFVLIDGKQLELKPPAADPLANKMGFYIHYPDANDLIDVFVKNSEGKIAYLAKNVQPSTWVYGDFATQEGFDNTNGSYTICFVKAGTTDVWAFMDSEIMSSTPFAPPVGKNGQVYSWFVTPGSADLRMVKLSE